MFRKESDFEAFERVMVEAHRLQPIRILSYCVLSNHWHFVVWPEEDGQLTAFFRRLAHTHAMRWRGQGARFGAHRSPGRPATQSKPIPDRHDKVTTYRFLERGTPRKH